MKRRQTHIILAFIVKYTVPMRALTLLVVLIAVLSCYEVTGIVKLDRRTDDVDKDAQR